MSTNTPGSHPVYGLLPIELDGFDSLAELALDMRWSWNHGADELWRLLDSALWDLTQNPWVVLQTVSRERLERSLADPVFRKKVDDLLRAKRESAEAPAWFQQKHPQSPLTCVAYFSMEFMLSEALPIYSGGLGNVAGDQLKAASDLGVPVVGIGLLYQQGYFRQVIDKDGAQQALYPYNDPGQLPITPVRQPNGEWLRLEIALPGYSVWLRAWQAQVGRVKLYLLDSNDAANFPAYRGITSELYGGGPELRLRQEMILGLGGWRLLGALGLKPEVCHLNEGHAAFAVLERARDFMEENKQPFEVALAATRPGNLFTTHTAVAAGFDRFDPGLMGRHLTIYAERMTKQKVSTWPTWPFGEAVRSMASAGCTGRSAANCLAPSFHAGRWTRPRSATSPMESMCPPGTRRRRMISGPRLAERPAGLDRRKRWNATFAGFRTMICGNSAGTPPKP
jgi:starch phosphorylase